MEERRLRELEGRMATQPVSMGRYWREASDLFFRRPILWLPVVVADLAGSLLNIAQRSVGRAIALSHTNYHSVLGGTVQQKGMTLQSAQQVYTWLTAIGWIDNFLRITLYVAAFVVTAALVWNGDRRDAWTRAFAALKQRGDGAMYLVLRALVVYAVAQIADAYLMRFLVSHQNPLAQSVAFRVMLALLLIAALVAAMSNAALKLLTESQPTEHGARSARVMALLMGAATVGLGYFVGESSMMLRYTQDAKRTVVVILGSLLTALPYILMFVGFGVISAVERSSRDEAA